MTKGCAQSSASRFDIIIKDVFNTRTEMENVKVGVKYFTDPNPLCCLVDCGMAGLCEVIQVADIQYFRNRVVGQGRM